MSWRDTLNDFQDSKPHEFNPQNPLKSPQTHSFTDITDTDSALKATPANHPEPTHDIRAEFPVFAEFSQSEFLGLVRHIGTDNQVRLEDSEILRELDAKGIETLAEADSLTRQSWAEAIALRLVRHRGVVPAGWTKTAHCHFCGPVYSYHDLHMCSCDWCEMRVAGKSFPQPDLEERTA